MMRIEPKQNRGREAERNIILAAQKVFSKKGFSGSTVADIVQEAGTSTGNFYYRFKNKEALFQYMLESFILKVHHTLNTLETHHTSIASLVYKVIAQNAKILDEHRGFYRAINEISIRNPTIWNQLKSLTEDTAQAVLKHAQPLLSEIAAPEPEQAIKDAIRLITGSLANQAVHYPNQLVLDEPKNILRLYRAAMGILQHYPAP